MTPPKDADGKIIKGAPTQSTVAERVQTDLAGGTAASQQGYLNAVGIQQEDTRSDIFARAVQQSAATGDEKTNERYRRMMQVRNRSYRGTQPKDESIASLRIISGLTERNPATSMQQRRAGGFLVFGTDQFVIQNAQETDTERVQLVETFGEPVAFFFGRRPRVFNYGGFLYNSGKPKTVQDSAAQFGRSKIAESMLWRDNFKMAYDLFLRGTKCVQFKARAYLTYDRVVREGFLLNTSISQDIRPNVVNFSFSMFVMREFNVDSPIAILNNTLGGELYPVDPASATPQAVAKAFQEDKNSHIVDIDLVGSTSGPVIPVTGE
jgi:hypothetical protein